jgi:hypothetical protein
MTLRRFQARLDFTPRVTLLAMHRSVSFSLAIPDSRFIVGLLGLAFCTVRDATTKAMRSSHIQLGVAFSFASCIGRNRMC